jgi:hypothetical protein
MLLRELQELLAPVVPGCSVHLFGSRACGLALPGSDYDIIALTSKDAPQVRLTLTFAFRFPAAPLESRSVASPTHERASSPTLQTLQEPILLKPWVCSRRLSKPYPDLLPHKPLCLSPKAPRVQW